jgi:hypothetical protein
MSINTQDAGDAGAVGVPSREETSKPEIELHVDLHQKKLSKAEWDYTEIPESKDEIDILNMIKKGFNDVNIKCNSTKSIIGVLKTSITEEIMVYLFNKYFKTKIEEICEEYDYEGFDCTEILGKNKNLKIKKIDEMRISNNNFDADNDKIYEYILLEIIDNLIGFYVDKKANWYYYYYTLYFMRKNVIENLNKYVIEFVDNVLKRYESNFNVKTFIKYSQKFVEKNEYLLKYQDCGLYEHQKQIFTNCKNAAPKLILYIAPTGTGKTLTPIGLSEPYNIPNPDKKVGGFITKKNRIIFVCAARHVGLALAKSAISAMKKIAFAFGCNSVSDIRLHYYSAKEATRDRNGRIRRVDNTVGDEVEIMISDIKSYIHAMLYMKAFNNVKDIITYFDEPTISLDYAEHDFHKLIKRNWVENQIPNIVLSSATLPHENEIHATILDFRGRFMGAEVISIVSHDCSKSIPIVNKDNKIELLHFLFEDYSDVVASAEHCSKYKTLLRYFDLNEIVKFVLYVNDESLYTSARFSVERYFADINDITMTNIKIYYLTLVKNIKPDKWSQIYNKMRDNRVKLYDSNIYFTTADAYTLTDGPTIFLTNDVEKIAKFAIQNSKIPAEVIDDLMGAIEHNNNLSNKIDVLEKDIQNIEEEKEKMRGDVAKDGGTRKALSGSSNIVVDTREIREKQQMIDIIRSGVRRIALNDMFVPNKLEHLRRWTNRDEYTNEFSCNLDESTVEKIMLLQIENHWKILLLMGIGAITNHTNVKYNEIIKELAQNQKLYLIIASSDYVYGTNYQFCHGYISKDLSNMTQEKTIQAMGRIGRNKLQQTYTVRFRDDELIRSIFVTSLNKPEVENMNKLFSSI